MDGSIEQSSTLQMNVPTMPECAQCTQLKENVMVSAHESYFIFVVLQFDNENSTFVRRNMFFILLCARDESGSMAGVVAFESKTFLCKVL